MSVLRVKDGIEFRSALRHFDCLRALACVPPEGPALPGTTIDLACGFDLWRKLRRVESWVANQCVRYSSDPDYGSERWQKVVQRAHKRVQAIFSSGWSFDGFYVNSDPRGYMLKINGDPKEHGVSCMNQADFENLMRCGMHHDMGSNLILAPEGFA